MQYCPATMRVYHQFNPKTHQCKCGRWERGYAPKKESTKPRAECQICEGVQALDANGCLGHHGYTRPGFGWIEGDCMGVKHKPYPATDALERYLAFVQEHLDMSTARLAALPTCEELTYRYEIGWNRNRQFKTATIRKGDTRRYDDGGHPIPEFDDHLRDAILETEADIERTSREVERVTKRIENAATIKH